VTLHPALRFRSDVLMGVTVTKLRAERGKCDRISVELLYQFNSGTRGEQGELSLQSIGNIVLWPKGERFA